MNPQEKRKQLTQIIVLVVLLAGLGGSMVYMFNTIRNQGRKNPTQQATSQVTSSASDAADSSGGIPAEEGKPIRHATTGAPSGEVVVEVDQSIAMNPNVFRVYDLDPPKNPFIQEEHWYLDDLERFPGYPLLRDNAFFETMEPVVPEVSSLLEEGEDWSEAVLERSKKEKRWVIEGHSEDDMIESTLTLRGPQSESMSVAWNRASGIPFDELSNPSWVAEYGGGQGLTGLSDGRDLFQHPDGQGLPLPTGAQDVSSMLTGDVPQGEMLTCHGVSGQGLNMNALISINGNPKMVRPGDALPPRFKVEAITAEGVVLIELQTDDTKWIPLGGPIALGGGASTARLPVAEPCTTSS